MGRPRKSEYPVVYYDDGIKVARNARFFPVYVEEWESLNPLIERSGSYRRLVLKIEKAKTNKNMIKDILLSKEDSSEEKLSKIKNAIIVMTRDLM